MINKPLTSAKVRSRQAPLNNRQFDGQFADRRLTKPRHVSCSKWSFIQGTAKGTDNGQQVAVFMSGASLGTDKSPTWENLPSEGPMPDRRPTRGSREATSGEHGP